MYRFQSLDALSDTIQRELAAKIVSKMLFQQLIFHIFTSHFFYEEIETKDLLSFIVPSSPFLFTQETAKQKRKKLKCKLHYCILGVFEFHLRISKPWFRQNVTRNKLLQTH